MGLNTEGLSAQDSTERLATCVSSALERDEYHQFYSEYVEVCLERGADPTAKEALPAGVPSMLMAVLLNCKVVDNIALRSAELLCQALRARANKLSEEEVQCLANRAQSAARDLKPRWKELWMKSR